MRAMFWLLNSRVGRKTPMPMSRREIARLIRNSQREDAGKAISELAAQRGPGPAADVLWLRGQTAYHENRYDEALENYRRALDMYRDAKDQEGQSDALCAMSDALRRTDQTEEAREQAEQALEAAGAAGYQQGEGNALRALGDLRLRTDDLAGVQQAYDQALALSREIGDRLGEANTLKALGDLRRRTADLAGAQQAYDQALPLFREIGSRPGEANTLRSLGDLRLRTGDLAGAQQACDQALGLYREIGDRLGEANAQYLLGRCLQELGKHKAAIKALRQAQQLYQEAGADTWASIASNAARALEATLRREPVKPAQSAVDDFFGHTSDQVAALLEKIRRSDERREQFLQRQKDEPANALIFARQWNSWQPLVPGEAPSGEEELRGGGYLLRWAGKGVAVDPGPGFLDLLCDGGFGLADVDAVLVTHHHIDHVADLPRILTLVHEYNEQHTDAKRRLDLFLSPSVVQAYAPICATSQDVGQFARLLGGDPLVPDGYSIEIEPFHAHHEELGGARHALSVAVKLKDPENPHDYVGTVAFMGDTGWRESGNMPLVEGLPQLPQPLCLVAHLGSVYPTDTDSFHANHLGYRGAAALLSRLKELNCFPARLVISEFGIECKPLVSAIVTQLADSVKERDRVCDGTLGRTILLPDMQVACDERGWPAVCCHASVKSRISDNRSSLIFRCEDHWPGD